MIVLYKSKKVEKYCNENAIKVFGDVVGKEIRKLIQLLKDSVDLNDIRVQKRYRLHKLVGNREGEYSITILNSSGLRMIILKEENIFIIKDLNVSSILIKEVVDYHG